MDVLKFLNDELLDEFWKNDQEPSRIAGLQAAISEITRLRAALEVFVGDEGWRQNGVLDANSGNFRGQQIAQEALNNG